MKKNNSKKVIIFITEAGEKKGLGHLTRTSIILKNLKNVEKKYLIINNEIKNNKIIHKLDSTNLFYKLKIDIYKIIKLINQKNSIIVVDMFFASEKLIKFLKKFSTKLIVFDDLKRNYNTRCIYIRSQEIFFKKIINKNKSIFFEGSSFFILNDELLNIRKKYKVIQPIKKIFFCIGGITPKEKIIKSLKFFDKNLSNKIINVFIGQTKLKKFKSNSNIFNFYTFEDNIKKILKDSDMGIISAGFIKFELMLIGIPFLLVSLNNHQHLMSKRFSYKKDINYLGNVDKLNMNYISNNKKISNFINKISLRNKISINNKVLIDGKGLKRFNKILFDKFIL